MIWRMVSVGLSVAIVTAVAVGLPLFIQGNNTKAQLQETEIKLEDAITERDSLQLDVEQLNTDLSVALDNIDALTSDLTA